MNYCSYEEYFAQFNSEPDDDDDDPVIEQLKYNAFFDDNKEPGWVIVLPDFEPHRYKIEPVVEPVIKEKVVRDPGLQHHNAVVNSMKDLMLKLSGINIHSNDDKTRTPPINDEPKQRATTSETHRHNEPHVHEYRRTVGVTHKHNKKRRKNATMPTHHHEG